MAKEATSQDVTVTTPYLIQHYRKETRDTFTLEVVPAEAHREWHFKPGQYNMLYMYGVGEVPISISGDPGDRTKIVHTIRAYGAVTSRMMTLKAGDVVGIRGPFGHPWPVDELRGHDILLVAGGIGLAPLRPVLYDILSRRKRFGDVILLYGERTPTDLIYRRQLEKWRGRRDLEIDITVDSAREGWRGNVGVVTKLIPKLRFDPLNTYAMLCGPEIMMDYTIQELEKKGLEENQIYVSMERNMNCGVGFCGHCQLGPVFVCKDGPVFRFGQVRGLFRKREM
jgi:NAD(P)H-flavin reductase